jgi:hypothetical protein
MPVSRRDFLKLPSAGTATPLPVCRAEIARAHRSRIKDAKTTPSSLPLIFLGAGATLVRTISGKIVSGDFNPSDTLRIS